MVKATKRCNDGSCSAMKSAFTKALIAVRNKRGLHLCPSTDGNASAGRRRSVSKGKGKISCRSCPGIISDFMVGLEDQRMVLISQMGFGSLVHMKIYKLNKDLGAWLLSKLDPVSGSIKTGARSSIKLSCHNTGLALGIPYEGKEINPATQQEVVTMKKYICSVFGKNSFEEITINGLFGILETKPKAVMSPEEIIQFKMPFIICLVTKFLAPVSLNNFISTRYIKALIDIENIREYNWAKFAIDELKLAAVSLQDKIENGKDAGYINGCIILLQVLYLDNLDFGIDSLPHDCFPRIRAFNDMNVATFIKRDIVLANRFPFPSFGKLKLRDPRQSCYAQHSTTTEIEDTSQVKVGTAKHGYENELSSHTLSTERVSKHTLPVSQVHAHTLSIQEVSAHTSPAKGVSNHALPQQDVSAHTQLVQEVPEGVQVPPHTPSVQVVSAHTPYGMSRSAHASFGIDPPSFDLGISPIFDHCNVRELSPEPQLQANLKKDFDMVADQDVIQAPDIHPSKQGKNTAGLSKISNSLASPHSILKEINGVRIVLREEYAVTKYPPKSKRKIIGQPGDMLLDRPKREIKPSQSVKSPFLSKQNPLTRHDVKAAQDLYNYIVTMNDEDCLKKIWVHISKPVPMSLKMKDIQKALRSDVEMEDETFNVAVQALFEDELERFGGSEFLGWRISTFLQMFAVTDDGHWDPEDHIHFFSDDTKIPYDVSKCQQIFIPIHEHDHYVLYAYDMENKKISVLDPVRDMSRGSNIKRRHKKNTKRISDALQDCFKLVFPGWNGKFETWEIVFPPIIPADKNKVNSAFLVLNYMRNFDGSRLVNPLPKDALSIRKQFLLNLLSFKNNEAILPQDAMKYLKLTNRI